MSQGFILKSIKRNSELSKLYLGTEFLVKSLVVQRFFGNVCIYKASDAGFVVFLAFAETRK